MVRTYQDQLNVRNSLYWRLKWMYAHGTRVEEPANSMVNVAPTRLGELIQKATDGQLSEAVRVSFEFGGDIQVIKESLEGILARDVNRAPDPEPVEQYDGGTGYDRKHEHLVRAFYVGMAIACLLVAAWKLVRA